MLLQITPSRIASFVSTSVRAQMAFALAFFAAAAGVLMAPTAGAQEIRPIVFRSTVRTTCLLYTSPSPRDS